MCGEGKDPAHGGEVSLPRKVHSGNYTPVDFMLKRLSQYDNILSKHPEK